MAYWLNDADTVAEAGERGRRIATNLLLVGVHRGIEAKEFNKLIGKIGSAFKELVEKVESEDDKASFMSLPWGRENMDAKELYYHCNELCFALFMGVEQAIDEEINVHPLGTLA
jgi:hypothetical protein